MGGGLINFLPLKRGGRGFLRFTVCQLRVLLIHYLSQVIITSHKAVIFATRNVSSKITALRQTNVSHPIPCHPFQSCSCLSIFSSYYICCVTYTFFS